MNEKFSAVAAPLKISGEAAGMITNSSLRQPDISSTLALSRYFWSISTMPLMVPLRKGQKLPMKMTATDDM